MVKEEEKEKELALLGKDEIQIDGISDAVFLSVLEAGFLTVDLLRQLSTQQLYFYTYLLITYDALNKKEEDRCDAPFYLKDFFNK